SVTGAREHAPARADMTHRGPKKSDITRPRSRVSRELVERILTHPIPLHPLELRGNAKHDDGRGRLGWPGRARVGVLNHAFLQLARQPREGAAGLTRKARKGAPRDVLNRGLDPASLPAQSVGVQREA